MSDQTPYPPPGSPPPPGPPPAGFGTPPPGADPSWGASVPPGRPPYPSPAAPGYPPVPFGAAHRPGAVPLRPLGLGDIYDGAFRILRINPAATVGAAVSVMALPVVVAAIASAAGGAGFGGLTTGAHDSGAAGIVLYFVGRLLQQLGIAVVTGLVARVAVTAAVGRRVGLSGAWAATAGRRGRLVLLVLLRLLIVYVALAVFSLIGTVILVAAGSLGLGLLWFLGVGFLVVIPATAVFWVRLSLLSTPVLMTEDVGVVESLQRAWRLSSGQFWRILGIALLTSLIVGVIGFVVAIPFGIVAVIAKAASDSYGTVIFTVAVAAGGIVSSAFVTPFQGTVATLMYLDQRMRKEGYEVELMTQAGLLDR